MPREAEHFERTTKLMCILEFPLWCFVVDHMQVVYHCKKCTVTKIYSVILFKGGTCFHALVPGVCVKHSVSTTEVNKNS